MHVLLPCFTHITTIDNKGINIPLFCFTHLFNVRTTCTVVLLTQVVKGTYTTQCEKQMKRFTKEQNNVGPYMY